MILCRDWMISEGPQNMWRLYSLDNQCHAVIYSLFQTKTSRFLARYLLGCRNYSYRAVKDPDLLRKILLPSGHEHTLEDAKAAVLKKLNAKIVTPQLMNLL